MKNKKILAICLVLTMILSACGAGGGGGGEDVAPAVQDAPATEGGAGDAGAAAGAGEAEIVAPAAGGGIGVAVPGYAHDADIQVMAVDRDFYEFTFWFAYSWRAPDPWGDCQISAHWAEMFNIYVDQSNPDANEMEMLMLMVAANDLPDAIWMDRNLQNQEIARMGLFVPVNDMIAMVNNNWYNENISPVTQHLLSVDGVNYAAAPNWFRTGPVGVPGYAPGGNMAWMVTTDVWEAVGSPELRTFEDLFDYAIAVRDANLTNSLGVPIIPMLTNDGAGEFGNMLIHGFYRSRGGISNGWWFDVLPDGTYGSVFRSHVWRDAVLEANRWFLEGLIPVTNFTNNVDEFRANLNTGRGGLIFYDHSADTGHNFRDILMHNDPGNSIEIVYIEEGGQIFIYPPAGGLPFDRIYHQNSGTLGWNSTFITTSAEQPGRIFEWITWLMTPMGAIEMMYGPRGIEWQELDANGFPIMLRPPASMTPAEVAEQGGWRWTLAGNSNAVDSTKFAVNNAMPPEHQVWVELIKYRMFSPYRMLSDEFELIGQSIVAGSDLAIRRLQIEDHFREMLPQIIMAGSRSEAEAMLDDALAFAEALGLAEVETTYHARWEYNKALQGGAVYRPPGT